MPNYTRQLFKQRKARLNNSAYTDFTVYYFADTEPTELKRVRPRKGELRLVSSSVPALVNMTTSAVDDLPWDEKDLSDFDLSDGDMENEDVEDVEEDSGISRMKEKKPSKEPSPNPGFIYPIDFWVILGDYISAEDVGTFARICQGAHMVTHSVRFWQSIYERYCKYNDTIKVESLPWDLHPKHMDRIHGLRTRVVRALFFMNPTFIQRLRSPIDPDYFQGLTCSWMWHQKEVQGRWMFNFKFLKKNKSQCAFITSKINASKKKGLAADDNIHNNPEEGYYILQALCPNFMSLTSIMGLVLTKTSISVSNQGMRYHKLRLFFDHSLCSTINSSAGSAETVLNIDPVLKVNILPWWHPKYPYKRM